MAFDAGSIVGIAVGVLVFIIVFYVVYSFLRRRRQSRNMPPPQ